MAFSPLSKSGNVNFLVNSYRWSGTEASVSQNSLGTSNDLDNSLRTSINKGRKGSLLYQVATKLLVTDKQSAQFKDSSEGLKEASENQIYNRLLTARLNDNKQFMQSLKDQSVESINPRYKEIEDAGSRGSRVVQLSDYRTTHSNANVIRSYLENNKPSK